MNDPHELREFSRVKIRLSIEVRTRDLALISEETRDLSMKGVYVATARRLALGTSCSVVLRLGGGGSSELRVVVSGQVVRVDATGMAIEFDAMGIDSFVHLRNLVLYNATDPEVIEQEFRNHVGIRRRA